MPTELKAAYVLNKLEWMRARRLWPNGLRYLWTDAFGVVLLVSLYDALGDDKFLAEAEWVVGEVDRVLRRPRGIRIGEEPDRDGQYFHYLAMWLYALAALGRHVARYREMGIGIVHEVHDAFLVPGRGVIWKMQEDLSAPYPGYGLGALDAFDGYVSYRIWTAPLCHQSSPSCTPGGHHCRSEAGAFRLEDCIGGLLLTSPMQMSGANFDGADLNATKIGKMKNAAAAENLDKAKNLGQAVTK